MLPVLVEFYTEGEDDETLVAGNSLGESETGAFLSSPFHTSWDVANADHGGPFGEGSRYLDML